MVNTIVTQKKKKKGEISVSRLNVLHSLHSQFILVSSKNHDFYTLLKIIELAVHALSLVCSNFSVIIHTEETNQEITSPRRCHRRRPYRPV